MVTSELCHVLVRTLPTPFHPDNLLPPAVQNANQHSPYCLESLSSCGEDMEASDAEVEEEILPPSKVTTPPSTFA